MAESRQLHFDIQPVDLRVLAEQAVGLFKAEADEQHITLKLEVDREVSRVQADPQRVEQVIGNLLSNAMRYVTEGGQVVVRVANADKTARFTVCDNGSGLPEADLPHIFDRFWRGDKSRNRSAGGAGLGLTIARYLIEAQKGVIYARNQPEGGLLVGFDLPVI